MKRFEIEPVTAEVGDLEFEIGGETFRRRPVVSVSVAKNYMALHGSTNVEFYKEVVDRISAFIDPDDETRFRERLEDETRPITTQKLSEVGNWLVEVTTGFPLQQDSDSSPGPSEKDGEPSKEESSSQEETRQPSMRAVS